MTLKERIRYICEALEKGVYLSVREIADKLAVPYGSVASLITKMHLSGQLKRAGKRLSYRYRAGRSAVTAGKRGRLPRIRTGFKYLARLEKENPAEWARITNGGRL